MSVVRLLRYPRQLHDVLSYWRAFRSSRSQHVEIFVAQKNEHLEAAKRLHAAVYLRRGFVRAADVRSGHLTVRADPHQQHATYFVAVDKAHGDVVATVRQIRARRKYGHLSFPMIAQANLYKRTRRLIASHAPEDCVEISGLAKQQAADSIVPLLLYRAMWQWSLAERHQLWLMACDVRLFQRLKVLFGPAVKRAGKVTPYYGGKIVPAVLDIQSSVRALELGVRGAGWMKRPVRRRVVDFFARDVPVDVLSPPERQALERLRHINSARAQQFSSHLK